METVILAAGRGTRMWPYGETTPKAALPVANRPLIRRLLDAVREAGGARATVVTGHLERQVRAALVDDDAVTFVSQPLEPGTAAAVAAALDELDDPAEVLVVCGDLLVDPADLRRLTEAFAAEPEAPAAALVVPLRGEDPRDWIGATVDGERVASIEGHPRGATHRLAGAYALRAAAYRYVRANPGVGVRVPVGGMPPLEADLNESLAMLLDRGQPVVAVEASGPFVDLDKPWQLLAANRLAAKMLFEGDSEGRIDPMATVHPEADIEGVLIAEAETVIGPRVRIRGRAYVGRGSRVDNGAILDGTVVIGRDCVVSDYCCVDDAVIGPGCRVRHCAELSGVLMEGCFLVHYMEFSGVLGRHSDLGAATVCGTLRFDDGAAEHRVKGRRERPRSGANESYLGDYTRTGVNAVIMPGCKVGPYSIVGPGVVLTEDLPARTCRLVKQEYADLPWGPERYGW